jgi:type I restriction enzyme, S subunit
LVLGRRAMWEELGSNSLGMGARRERLQVPDFLDAEMELPPLHQQKRIVEDAAAATGAVAAAAAEAKAAFVALNAATNHLLGAEDGWEELPDDWTLRTLADVCEIRSGITKGRTVRAEVRPAPFIRAANVQNGYLDLTEIKTLDITANERSRFALDAGDVLLIEGGNAEHLGRGWVWEGEIEGAVAQNHVFRARPDQEQVLPRFLAYVVGAAPAREYCFEHSKRTTQRRTSCRWGCGYARARASPSTSYGTRRRIGRESHLTGLAESPPTDDTLDCHRTDREGHSAGDGGVPGRPRLVGENSSGNERSPEGSHGPSHR